MTDLPREPGAALDPLCEQVRRDYANSKPFQRRPGADQRWKTTRGMNSDRELSASMAGSTTRAAERQRQIAKMTTDAALASTPVQRPHEPS
jgi:hypothetical protein